MTLFLFRHLKSTAKKWTVSDWYFKLLLLGKCWWNPLAVHLFICSKKHLKQYFSVCRWGAELMSLKPTLPMMLCTNRFPCQEQNRFFTFLYYCFLLVRDMCLNAWLCLEQKILYILLSCSIGEISFSGPFSTPLFPFRCLSTWVNLLIKSLLYTIIVQLLSVISDAPCTCNWLKGLSFYELSIWRCHEECSSSGPLTLTPLSLYPFKKEQKEVVKGIVNPGFNIL